MRTLRLGLAVLLSLVISSPLLAQQSQGTILGTIVTESGAPIGGASVSVRRMADSVVVASVVTSATGAFLREGLPFGAYRIEVTQIGRSPEARDNVTLSAASPRLDLGRIGLREAVQVQGVTAEVQRSPVIVAPDRSIYTVREMPLAQSGVATDALRAIPELEVDVDDNIRARGAEPMIFLDGRPMPMQGEARTAFLRTLRADRIDRIEYIPNPSARYEAEGQSGIVNIVLRRDVGLGLSGSVAANAGTRGTQNVSSRVNYQQGRITIFGGGLIGFNQAKSNSLDFRENLAAQPVTFLQQETNFRQNGLNGGGDVTAEYKLTQRSMFWSILRGNIGDVEDTSQSEFIHQDASRVITDRYERERERDVENLGLSSAIGFRRVVQPQRNELSAELRYNGTRGDGTTGNWRRPFSVDGNPLSLPPDLTEISADGLSDTWGFQVDLSRPLLSNVRLDLGYRGNFRVEGEEQDVAFFTNGGTAPSQQIDAVFDYEEDSHAAYFNLDRTSGKLGLQAGLRVEDVTGYNTSTGLVAPVRTNDRGLYPSANVAYDFGGGRQLRLSYARRVQRPGTRAYSPLNQTPADPFNRETGNPLLTPAQINMGTLDASWTGALGTLRMSQMIGKGRGFWLTTRSVDENGVSTLMPENVASATVIGTSVNGSVRQLGPLSGFVNLNAQYIDFTSGLNSLESNAFIMWATNANVTATLPHDLRVQVTAAFAPGQYNPEGRRAQQRQLNLAFTQRVLQDRAVLTLSVVDPFDLTENGLTYRNSSVLQTGRTSNSIRRATFTLTYNFGRAPQSNRRVVADDPQGGGGGGLGGQ